MPDTREQLERVEDLEPVVASGVTVTGVSDQISDIVLKQPNTRLWLGAAGLMSLLVVCYGLGIGYTVLRGVGVWGIDIPVAWGFAIASFVWWIGIGHAGTLISAILLLLHQDWRNSVNRFAEAMTLFAVMCAGMYPLIHLGRPYLFYWLMPYPNTMSLWPQFRSPLVWDVFAVSTYFTVSLIFWYSALIPDLATIRDHSTGLFRRKLYGIFALGWRGSAKHWHNFKISYLLLAGLATPLVISVHTVVSFDFAVAMLPGWHSTIFPPYFVAGAIFSGFAMVVMLAVPIRKIFHLENIVTIRHLDNCGKLMLATGLIVGYGYLMEQFMSWYSADTYEQFIMFDRMFGPYATVFWTVILCNVVASQALWFKRVRRNPGALFVVAFFIQTGMWLERYMIVVQSLHADFLPRSWGMYSGTWVDWMILLGSMGFFCFAFFLFIRYLPMIPMFEMRETVREVSCRSTD
jgi:Ni/Fe-hydrogenase subunit HybB-like protein